MPFPRRLLARIGQDVVLLSLLLALVALVSLRPSVLPSLPALVEWRTLEALAGLLILSRGLEDSGYLARLGRVLIRGVRNERALALALMGIAALLAAVVTNDVALFVVVPLTLGLRALATVPLGRLIVFEALAVNAGSTLSPVGNPQNLFLWQVSGLSFGRFLLTMIPFGLALLLLLAAMVPAAFPAQRVRVNEVGERPVPRRGLLSASAGLYPAFLLAVDLGHTFIATLVLGGVYLVWFRRVLAGVDWLLLAVFALMFIDFRLLASCASMGGLVGHVLALPGGTFTAGVLFSQVLSNVPAAIFLASFSSSWPALAWGVNAGGFGLALGSLANLIALRLAGQRGLWRDFHAWSLPALAGAWIIGWALLSATGR